MEKIKIILVGDGGVGKTCLISQYISNSFVLNHIMTTGIDKQYKEIEIKNKKLKIEIWDTAGQEQYRSVNKLLMKNTQIALVVYDITNEKSFNELNYWINLVKDNNKEKEIIFGIAANKSDLFENQIVSREKGKKFADDNSYLFFETSAMDYKSIDNAFNKLCEAFVNKFLLNENEKSENNENDNKNKNINNKNDGNEKEKENNVKYMNSVNNQHNIVLNHKDHQKDVKVKGGCCLKKKKKNEENEKIKKIN